MAAKIRKDKSSVSSQLHTMQMLSAVIEPTLTLNPAERLHFDRVIASRETDTWGPHDISVACQLAKQMLLLENAQRQVEEDGLLTSSARGTTIAHPLLASCMSISSSIQALTRTLGLGASQRGLSGPKQANRNKADLQARQVIERVAEDDLLA